MADCKDDFTLSLSLSLVCYCIPFQYYDDTIFHRIIAGFMVQGGDPTGTGSGGESVFPTDAFADEFHSRLRFTHRGLLAMANENTPNSNHSQFFFTLDACEFLNQKHTIFGKVRIE